MCIVYILFKSSYKVTLYFLVTQKYIAVQHFQDIKKIATFALHKDKKNMLLNIFILLLGLVLILAGANFLTDGASAIARRWGVSDMVVGLTVVAFGTSTPELVISVVSAIEGSGQLAIGNAVGSNIFNIMAIIGITAMVKPIKVPVNTMTADIPFVIISSLVILAMGAGTLLGNDGGRILWRSDGIVLLLFFAIFMRYTFSQAKHIEPEPQTNSAPSMSAWKAWLWVALGLAGLVWGGDKFVEGASYIAKALGVSDAIIGLTIVAAGTSLPELAASVVAAVKGKPGIALGNVIGSNIFNIFFVLGTAATIRPLEFGGIGTFDLLVLAVASILFWLFGWFIGKRTITRAEGAVLTAGYVAYVAYLISIA